MVDTMRTSLRHVLCAIVLLAGVLCLGQTVAVRVIDEKGKPLEKRRVAFSVDGLKNGQPVGRDQNQETDAKGEARFALASSPPDVFFFYVDLGSPYWHCGCVGIAKTKTVVEEGILQSAATKNSEGLFKTKPGEVLIVARKLSFMERLLYPLMKD